MLLWLYFTGSKQAGYEAGPPIFHFTVGETEAHSEMQCAFPTVTQECLPTTAICSSQPSCGPATGQDLLATGAILHSPFLSYLICK